MGRGKMMSKLRIEAMQILFLSRKKAIFSKKGFWQKLEVFLTKIIQKVSKTTLYFVNSC